MLIDYMRLQTIEFTRPGREKLFMNTKDVNDVVYLMKDLADMFFGRSGGTGDAADLLTKIMDLARENFRPRSDNAAIQQ